jgi:hypothetical protein
LREAQGPVLIGGAAGQRDGIVKRVLEGAAGIVPEAGGVIESPMVAPLEEDAWIELVNNRFGLLAGRGLKAVAVGKAIIQMGLKG